MVPQMERDEDYCVARYEAFTLKSKQLKFEFFGVTMAKAIPSDDGSTQVFQILGMNQPNFLKKKKLWKFGKFGVGDLLPTMATNLLQCNKPCEISSYVENKEEESSYAKIAFSKNKDSDSTFYVFVFVSVYRHVLNKYNHSEYYRYVSRNCRGSVQRRVSTLEKVCVCKD